LALVARFVHIIRLLADGRIANPAPEPIAILNVY
jgi:hypothetical protein